MIDKEIEVLQLLNIDSNLSQRKIAAKANISIGKVNYTINKLKSDDMIKSEKVSGKVVYEVQAKGINVLEEYIKSTSSKKIILQPTSKKINQAVILAAGRRKDFDMPIGLLEVEGITLVERSLKILIEHGIQKVVIVTGYEDHQFDKLKDIYKNVDIVNNDKYKWTGTMSSLSLTKQLIDDDFLLIESDLIFEERAINEVINNINRDCILITSESGSGDEAFVEIRGGYVFKMSKDIHQFNRIDGEMIGISKISIDIFKKMLELFEGNQNPYLNYEYALLDVGRSYNVGYTKIDDLVWSEVDNLEQYEKVKNYIFPKLKRKEMEIKTHKIRNYISHILNIDSKDINNIIPFGGMTNKNYKVSIGHKNYVIRIPGAGTEEMIDRKAEKINSELAYKLGLDIKVLSFEEETGIKLAKFIENAETLNSMTAKKEGNMKLVTAALKKLHNSSINITNEFNVFEKIEYYEYLLRKVNGNNFEDYNLVKEKVMKLKSVLQNLGAELKPCHNDTLPENFIKTSEYEILLIDWEYSGLNDPMWDLAAHSLEADFSEDDEELFLSYYFEDACSIKDINKIIIYKICQDFLWSIWTNIKEAKGDNFGTYGIDRYNRAKQNLIKLEQLMKGSI